MVLSTLTASLQGAGVFAGGLGNAATNAMTCSAAPSLSRSVSRKSDCDGLAGSSPCKSFLMGSSPAAEFRTGAAEREAGKKGSAPRTPPRMFVSGSPPTTTRGLDMLSAPSVAPGRTGKRRYRGKKGGGGGDDEDFDDFGGGDGGWNGWGDGGDGDGDRWWRDDSGGGDNSASSVGLHLAAFFALFRAANHALQLRVIPDVPEDATGAGSLSVTVAATPTFALLSTAEWEDGASQLVALVPDVGEVDITTFAVPPSAAEPAYLGGGEGVGVV